jgi:YD repeat-containing protein
MTSATNPENGAVTYTYDLAHRVTSRTDAIGQQTQYDHDAYGRVSETRHYNASATEITADRVDYTYDSGTYGQGHLTGVSFGGGMADVFSDIYGSSLFQVGRGVRSSLPAMR